MQQQELRQAVQSNSTKPLRWIFDIDGKIDLNKEKPLYILEDDELHVNESHVDRKCENRSSQSEIQESPNESMKHTQIRKQFIISFTKV